MAAIATNIGSFFSRNSESLSRVSGIIIILFGLILLFPSLNKKYFYGSNYIDVKNFNLFKNFLLGLTFGFGFTPCIGPVLGALLTLSSSTNTIREGVTLLIFSSKINLKSKVFVLFQKYSSFISGSTLIAIGILIFTDRMYVLASFFQELFVLLNLEWLSTI